MSVLFKCDNCRHHLKSRYDPDCSGWFPVGGVLQVEVFYKHRSETAHFCDKHCVEMFFLNQEEEFIYFEEDNAFYSRDKVEVGGGREGTGKWNGN